MNWKVIAVAAVVLIGVVVYVMYSPSTSNLQPQGVEEPISSEQAPAEPTGGEEAGMADSEGAEQAAETEESAYEESMAEEEPDIVEPPQNLAGSDERVMEAAEDLDPKLSEWLDADQQVRKWTVAVDQLAEGRLPTKHRPLTFEPDPFLVIKDGDKFYQDSGNFDRWDPLINTVTSTDPETMATYYQEWLPLFERAYSELGKSGSFDTRVRRTIHELLAVGPVPEDAALVRPHVFYEYADPELENASPLTKWMWRLGSDNKQELQEYLREFDAALLE